MTNKRKAIVVLGMHRSGTSAITRVLGLLGLGLPERLMSPVSENNETGFWESSAIAETHDRLLAEVGSSWDDCLRFPRAFYGSEAARNYSAEMIDILNRDFPSDIDLVIKDPRICRLLPFWIDILDQFGADPFFVLISRHPLEVAASLARRDHFPEARSLHLWLRHTLDMEHDTRGQPRSLITYDELLENWRTTVGKISTDLGVAWPKTVDQVRPDVDEFLSPSLRHHRLHEEIPATDNVLYDWVARIHATYVTTARHGRPIDDRVLDEVSLALDSAEGVFAPAMAAVQSGLKESSLQADKLARLYADAEARHEALERAHERDKETYETEIRKNRKSLETLDEQIYRQRDQADARITDLEATLQVVEREKEAAEKEKGWLWERWHESKGELDAMQTSKVGRLLWGPWAAYLNLRRRLVGMRYSVSGRSDSNSEDAGAGGWMRDVLRWPAALIARTTGLVYLATTVGWEQLAAQGRRTLRQPSTAPSRKSTVEAQGRQPRVLLVSPYPIYPPNHGGGVRLFNLIQRLSEHCELHLLIFSQSGEDAAQRQALSGWTRSIHFHHWQPGYALSGFHLEPPNARLFASKEAAQQISELLDSKSIDILQLENTELGQYGLREFPGVKTVLTEIDLAFQQHRRRSQMGFHRRFPEGNAYGSSFGDWLRLVRHELTVCRRADQIHVMSRTDGQFLSDYLGDGWSRIRVVPNAVDTAFYHPSETTSARSGVLYVGNFQHLPNVDALEYLADEIWPLVRAGAPDTSLAVVGAHPSHRVTKYHGQDGIEVIGGVPDLRPYYHSHRLMVAPIRAGSGTRLKILEAFASGIPVVSTSLGAEGIEAEHDRDLLLADEPREFADAVLRLQQDDGLCDRLSSSALSLAGDRYDWWQSAEAILSGWSELLEPDRGGVLTGHPDR